MRAHSCDAPLRRQAKAHTDGRPSLRTLASWFATLGIAWLLCVASGLAHEAFTSEEVKFSTGRAEVAGTLLLPHDAKHVPCVIIVGGTVSQTRDGALVDRTKPSRDALKRLAEALFDGGYASLRFDRVGFGQSKAKPKWTGTYMEEAQVASAAIRFARARKELSKVLVAAESAGAYMVCLAAKEGAQADGYIFLGGLCSSSADMYEYNFGRLRKYAESTPDNLAWVKEHARRDLAIGRQYRAMLDAAAAGQSEFELVDDDFKMKLGLARRQEELNSPPDEMFRYIRVPALALAGAKDLNVPPHHAARAVQIMHQAGNANAVSFLIPAGGGRRGLRLP